MKSRSNVELRRCRPLLGTFVEIQAAGTSSRELERGVAAAFASIEKVHRLMSYHDPQSDVSRMNREAFPKSVVVHPWTWRVLEAAQRFARESGGVFDIAVARLAASPRSLSRHKYPAANAATWRDIFLRRNCRVFFRRPVTVDLGGIAKGFAVDRAVAALRRNNVGSGIVNAGGDIRVFGAGAQRVHVRNPVSPGRFSAEIRLRNLALATSAIYFAPDALYDGRTRRALARLISVTVAARDCMTADALTKVVFALREDAAPLLRRYRADALILDRRGLPCWVFKTHAP